jgi:hypothetical protein
MENVSEREQFAARLFAVEQEAALLRQEIARLSLPETKAAESLFISSTEQNLLADAMAEMFADMQIQGQPVGAERLQEMMRAANLAPSEMSRGIIDMRDE